MFATIAPSQGPLSKARAASHRALASTDSYDRRHEREAATGVSGGGRGDFDRFFREHYGPIVRSLTAAFGDAEASAEATQDAFVKAYARWRRVRGMDAPAAWIRHVAINRLRDHHRSAVRARRAEERAAANATITSPAAESGDDIVRLLAPLAERQRTAMALYYVEDLPVAEIAASMGISQGAVKAHLSQARANVARFLEGEVADHG